MNKPKILFYDIESAGVNALKSDLGFVIIFGYKWAHEKRAHALIIDPKSLNRFQDRNLLKNASKLIIEADLVVTHYGCVAPNTKVLMADFTYRAAKNLKVGDELITLDENPKTKRARRQFSIGIVKHAAHAVAPKIRLTLSDGTILDVTKTHPFLVPRGKNNQANWSWIEAQKLKPGDVLTRILPVWETQYGYEAGWLAAAVDGEGYVSSGKTIGAKLGFAQKPNEMLDQFRALSNQQGFTFKEYWPNTNVKRLSLQGIFSVFSFLGTIRPSRLLARFKEKLPQLCIKVPKINRTTVVSVNYIGKSSIINLTTSTSTYITEGFGSHNSIFDRRFINGRLLINKLPPIPFTKMRDTCIIARSVANFSSNRLKHLAKILDLRHKKLENNWPIAWFKVMQGDVAQLNALAKYCRGDVLALEDLYFKLRPFDNAHPRIVEGRSVCGSCGGKVEYRGFSWIGPYKYRRYVCTKCHKWARERNRVKGE